MFSFWFIVVVGFIAVFAYLLAPDNSPNANEMHLEIHSKKPGFSVLMLHLPTENKVQQSFFNKLFYGNKNSSQEIPIKSYIASENEITYQPFSNSSDDTSTKSVSLIKFNDKPISSIVKKKKFYLGTDK